MRETLRSGKFVSDDKAIDVIKNARLNEHKDTPALIFDGMPRTIEQAQMLADQNISVDVFVNFFNRDDILLEKLLGRRVCPKCSRNYNVSDIDRDGYRMRPVLPKNDPTKCDDCNMTLIIRDDDKESIIRERMVIYRSKTAPLI